VSWRAFRDDTRGQPVGLASAVLTLIGFALVFLLLLPIEQALYDTFTRQTSTAPAQTGLDRTHTLFEALPFFIVFITFVLGLVTYTVYQRPRV
jgi:hypothetical protein